MSSHIDSANEEPTQELPLIEEPDDQDTEEEQQEGPPQTTDSASAEANSDEEGRQDHTTTQQMLNDFKLCMCIRSCLKPFCIRLPGRPGPSTYT